jgi:putative DNA primase/helicase
MYQVNVEKGAIDPKKEKAPRRQKVTRSVISDVLQALKSECGLASSVKPPCWLTDGPPASELIATRSGLLHLPSFVAGQDRAFTASTPRFFTFNRVGFEFEEDAPPAREWLRFLSQLWPDDPDSIACLQEWFGYLLTCDTSMHKMLLIIGPPRAGKGTIARVLKALLGEANVAAPTLGRLADRFGLQDLIGKPLAMVADARLSGRHDAVAVTEELLSISGEDDRCIDRKNLPPITMKLPTRFVFMTNEMPGLGDASGAILSRLVILRLTRSFLGCEDLELFARLVEALEHAVLHDVSEAEDAVRGSVVEFGRVTQAALVGSAEKAPEARSNRTSAAKAS